MSARPRPGRASGPDWILIGALAGLTLFTGAVAFGMLSMIWADKAPPKKAVAMIPLVLFEGPTLPERPAPEQPSIAPAPLSPPAQPAPPSSAAPPQRKPVAVQPPAEAPAQPRPTREQQGSAVANAPTSVKPPVQQAPVVTEQWRVVATANASAFNLGGHINKAGIVDSLASSHLRDALKAHRNFGRLPPHLRAHIETQNIDLRKLAPYRALVGIDDSRLEADQGVRFERVVASR
ncbi:MAG: hypothetical protein ABWY64_18280 [Tardiphaga sp.]